VRGLRFTPDGAALLVGGGPRTLRLFDPVRRNETAILWESPPPQMQAVFAAAQDQEAKQKADPGKGKEEAKPQPAAPPRDWPEQVDIQFNKGLDVYQHLSLFGPDAAIVATVGPQGLRLTLSAGREEVGEAGDVGVETRKVLHGDFEITLAYELIALPKPGPKWGAGVVLDATFDAPDSPRVRLTRTQKANFGTFGSTYYALDNNGKRIGQGLQYPRANENVRTGRLRLLRVGVDLAFQVDEGGTGFRTIATREVGGGDVVSVRAFATSGEKPLLVDLRFTNLELLWAPATKIAAVNQPGGERPGGSRSRGWLAAAALVAGLVVLSVAGVVLVARRRGADRRPQGETPETDAPAERRRRS
jgi:hypothetical protein